MKMISASLLALLLAATVQPAAAQFKKPDDALKYRKARPRAHAAGRRRPG